MSASVSKWIRRLIALAFVAGIIGLVVMASLPQPVSVDAAEVVRAPMEVTIDEDGTTRVKDRYIVSSPLSGSLARIELRPGDPVTETSILARLEPLAPQLMDARSRAQAEARVASAQAAQRQARAGVSRATAAQTLAEQSMARQETLLRSGGVSAQSADQARFEARARSEELTSARFGVRVADYEVRMAQAALGRHGSQSEEAMELPSPIEAGVVLRVIQQDEGVVHAGTPLVEVGNPAALEVAVDVLTADAVQVRPGAFVTLERWGGDAPLEGHVQRVEPSAFTKVSALGVEEQRVNVVIDLDSPRADWTQLGDGYRVEARIRVWREEETLQVPSSALFRHGEGWAVFRVDGETAVLQPVEIGRRNGFDTEITGGLDAGMQVVVHPSDSVQDGAALLVR